MTLYQVFIGTDCVADYEDKRLAQATACQHLATRLQEMKDYLQVIERAIRDGDDAQALTLYEPFARGGLPIRVLAICQGCSIHRETVDGSGYCISCRVIRDLLCEEVGK